VPRWRSLQAERSTNVLVRDRADPRRAWASSPTALQRGAARTPLDRLPVREVSSFG
jgi:hypothetical protein